VWSRPPLFAILFGMTATTVWFNPNCSKCRAVREILTERGVEADYRHYLETPPTLEELARVLEGMDGTAQNILRSKEAAYGELGLAEATDGECLQALTAHPELLNRPILEHEGKSIVARPAELALDLL